MKATKKPVTPTLAEVLAACERAEARVAAWPQWKRDAGGVQP